MMTFVIKETQQIYEYPETPNDITLSQFAYFNTNIRPKQPTEINDFNIIETQLEELYNELLPYAKKAKVSTDRKDIGVELSNWLEKGVVNDNAKRFLPSILASYIKTRYDLQTILNQMDGVWLASKWYPYMIETVNYFTGIPSEILELNLKTVEFLFTRIIKAIDAPKELDYKQVYLFNGQVYKLPEKEMSKSTLQEFAEAAQFDRQLSELKNGNTEGLIGLCAVLLKKDNEQYSDAVFERNMQDFQQLPLSVAYEVAFFLQQLSAKLLLDFQIYTLKKELTNITQDLLN